MSDPWIEKRLLKAVNFDEALALKISNNYQRVVAKVSPDGNITYRKVKENGYQDNTSSGIWEP